MKPIWILVCAIAIVGSNSLLLSPIAVEVAASFPGQTAPDVMVASSIFGAGTAISALFLAPRADAIGLRRALFAALAGLVTALCLSAIAPELPILIAAQAFAGVAAGLALPAIYGLAAEIAEKGHESATLGKVLTGWTLSLVVGVSFSALIADFLHWRAVFALHAGVGLSLMLLYRRAYWAEPVRSGQFTSPLAAIHLEGLKPIPLNVTCYMVAFYGLENVAVDTDAEPAPMASLSPESPKLQSAQMSGYD